MMNAHVKYSLEELFKNEKQISVDDFLDKIHKLHFAYIKYILQEQKTSLKDVFVLEDDAEFLIGMCTHPFMAKYQSSQIYRDGLSVCATIFEFLGDISEQHPEDLDEKDTYYLKSALCYSLSGYESRSTIISSRIINSIGYSSLNDITLMDLTLPQLSHYSILKILSISKGEFFNDKIKNLIIMKLNKYTKLNIQSTASDITLNGIYINLILACLDIAEAIDFGTENAIQNGFVKLENVRKASAKLGYTNYFFISDSLLDITNKYWLNSPWNRLKDIIKKDKYIKLLINDGVKIFWSSQIEALELKSKKRILKGGYLDNHVKRIVVNMPTSAGKSLVAELLLAKTIFENRLNKCVYVVPTKALVAQVTKDLSKRFRPFGIRVTATYNDQEVAKFESIFFETTRVIVVTPEKLNYLIRQASGYILECKLYIFDEIHNISDGNRGWTYEETISLLLQNPSSSTARMMFMSAIMPNSFTIREWVDPKELNNVIKTNWQPTRQLKAVLKEAPKIRTVNTVKTFKGLQADLYLARNKEDIKTRFHIPNLFQTRETYGEANWQNKTYVNLVKKFKKFGTVLIYFPTRKSIKEFCNTFIDLATDVDYNKINVDELMNSFKDERLQEDHILYKLVKYGIAYHDGSLSNEIRLAIEEAFKQGILTVLATSKTLIQGVNMPAKSFIVSDYAVRYGKTESYKIEKKDFKNLLGRVGRAAYDTEGQIVFCNIHHISDRKNNISLADSSDKIWQDYLYISENDEALTINSSLSDVDTIDIMEKLCDAIDEGRLPLSSILNETEFQSKNENKRELIKKVQAYALFQNTLDHNIENNYSDLLNDIIYKYTLIGQSTPNILTKFTYYSADAINNKLSKELQLVYRRTALSTQSSMKLYNIVDVFWEQINVNILQVVNAEFVQKVSSLIFDIPEFKPHNRYKDKIGLLISNWIFEVNKNYNSNESFFNLFKENILDDSKKNTTEEISELYNHFFADLIDYKAPWALSSFFILSEFIIQKKNLTISDQFKESISLLSAYCKYGVFTPSSALFCSLGLKPAYLSLKLSNVYESIHGYYNFDYRNTILWFMSMKKNNNIEINFLDLINEYNFSEKEVRRIINVKHELDDYNEIDLPKKFGHYLVKDMFLPSWKYMLDISIIPSIKVGDFCDLVVDNLNQINPNSILVVWNDRKVAYLPHDLSYHVRSLMKNGYNLFANISIANADAISSYKIAVNISVNPPKY